MNSLFVMKHYSRYFRQTVLKMMSFRLVLKLFQIFSLLNSVATSAEDDEKTLFEKEMEIISKLMGYCPYCDPNFIDIPNLQSAMKGYDLPMGDPNRKYLQGFEKKNVIFLHFFPHIYLGRYTQISI